ncbi:MAG: hypothetical protein ACRD0X_03630 [Thermoanaerobaculia bacterium]
MTSFGNSRALTLTLLFFGSSMSLAAGSQRVAFVTSAAGGGDLSKWPDAKGQVGLAAADIICEERAAAAGLANPQNFVAWLSDPDHDAYCRVHNLTGKKANNCRQSQLPAAAGPWVRTTGFPFSDAITLLTTSGVVYAPLRYDEFGDPIPDGPGSQMFTATAPDGTLTGAGSCAKWSSDSDLIEATVGNIDATTQGWTTGGSLPCAGPARLICVETFDGPPLPDFAQSGRRAFVTSATGSGDLASWPEADPGASGIEAGDSICRNLALLAGFEEAATFKAWLSDTLVAAPDRFVHDGRWVRPDGVIPAAGIADLTDGLLFTSINVTEQGNYLGNHGVWTGTEDSGLPRPDHCSDWTDGTAKVSGAFGVAYLTRFGWSWLLPRLPCDFDSFRLYCLSDAETTIFADGFESGDTSAWSTTVP